MSALSTLGMSTRLILALTVTVSFLWLCAAGLSGLVLFEEYGELSDSALKEMAERLVPLAMDNLTAKGIDAMPRRIEPIAPGGIDQIGYVVRNETGAVLMHSREMARGPIEAPLRVGYFSDAQYRIYTAAAPDKSLYIQVGAALDERTEASLEATAALLLPILIIIPLSAIAIQLVVRRVLRPVTLLRDAIATRDSGNSAPIATAGLPPELTPIASSVNLLLERLGGALQQEREFAANSAHELRTPIAGALAQAQRLLAELPDGPDRHRAVRIREALERLARLIEKLLELARADAGIGSATQSEDLVPILRDIVEDMRRNPPSSNRITLIVAPDVTLPRAVDLDAFAIVMRNLIDNARRHGIPGTDVEIHVDETGLIRIINDCEIIDAAALAGLTERFVRGTGPAAGAGLGLSIVAKLARQMHAGFELRSPADGRNAGLEARIGF